MFVVCFLLVSLVLRFSEVCVSFCGYTRKNRFCPKRRSANGTQKLSNTPADRQTDRQAGRQAGGYAGRQAFRQIMELPNIGDPNIVP